MTIAKTDSSKKVAPAPNSLVVESKRDETDAQAVARTILNPGIRHAVTASEFGAKIMAKDTILPDVTDYNRHISADCKKVEGGDLAFVSRMLTAQAITLDTMFTEFSRRAAMNMGEYVQAAETYSRLALKAQSGCRSTLEAITKLHQPREQVVRHVHVNEGGRAVIADDFHLHKGDA